MNQGNNPVKGDWFAALVLLSTRNIMCITIFKRCFALG
jgi:hypothetical protein